MKKLASAFLMLLFAVATAFAQTTTGRLVGTVSGPDGVLAGATVVVKDDQTAREQTVSAKEDGTYIFPQLEVGTYTVTITAPGFKTYVATELKIDIGREYSLNPTLEIGGVTETVTVSAGTDIINATSPAISSTVSPQQILQLPLVARNPLNLINLQAGATPNAGFQLTTINGMRTTFTNITRDGINIQDAFIRANATDFAPGRPSVDDTGEFTISTANSDADAAYGGAQVRLVTPRGESSFHGALFAYNRNSEFAANNFFSNRAGSFAPNSPEVLQGRAKAGDPRIPRPFRNRNQYGGKIGGPLWLPRFGEGGPSWIKDKAFFFFNYEALRDPVSTLSNRTILTPSARQGGFTFNATCVDTPNQPNSCPAGVKNGQRIVVPNILTFARGLGAGFASIPASIDPVVQARILSGLPETGNRSDIGDQLNTTGFSINRASNQTRDSYATRIDVDINDRNSINGVYTWNKEFNLRPDADNNPITAGYTAIPMSDQSSTNRLLALAYRSTITTNFINEVRGGYFKSDVPFNRRSPIPSFFITPTLVNPPETQFLDQGRNTVGYNIQDSADWIVGNHSLRMGGIFQWYQVDSYNDALIVPTYTLGTGTAAPVFTNANFASLGGISNAQLGTANGLLALLGGIVTGGSQSFNTVSQTSGFTASRLNQPFRYENHSLYIQDRWRVKPSLSLTLGLRYEFYPALELANGLALEPVIPEGADPVQAILNPLGTYDFVGTNAGKKNAYYKTDYNNFAPTVGFAWSPQFKNNLLGALFGEGRTTIRGGYAMAYVNDSLVTSINNAAVGNVGLGRTGSSALNPLTGQQALNDRLGNGVTSVNPPTFITPPRTFLQNNGPGVGNNFGTVFAIDPNIQTPRVEQYSFGIQREIGFQTAIEVRYVGTRSNNLARSVDYNQVDIFNNGFLADFERARANLALKNDAFCASAGCQALTLFKLNTDTDPLHKQPLIVGTQFLNLTTFVNNLRNGTPADLALLFINNGLNGGPTVATPSAKPFVNFLPNPGTGVANMFENGGFYNYNSLQAELRRRFSNGLYFQANYTFSKNLTNAIGTSQTLVEPFLDNNNKQWDKMRADYDVTHVFNMNAIYELPFGRGKKFFTGAGGFLNQLVGGWQVAGIAAWTSGSPLTFVDTRGTFNRGPRSARQTANTNLTNDQIRDLVGFYEKNGSIYFIDPSVISAQGAASNGFGTAPFQGQAFFNVQPGQTGNMARAVIDGPGYFNLDASLFKSFNFGEKTRLQLRMEAFNALNNVNFLPAAQVLSITSTSFGQLTQTSSPRVVQFAARFEF